MRKANARPGGEFRWGCGYFKWGRGGGLRVSDYCSWQVAVRFPGDPPPPRGAGSPVPAIPLVRRMETLAKQ